MHIMEGFLPVRHALGWFAVAVLFWLAGVRSLKRIVRDQPSARLLLGAAGAFVFVLSALKLPSVTGSCSHPTGIGLGAILFGPSVMSVLGAIVLLFQALLLAHGGLTTLGANTFSMAIVGPWVAYGVFRALRGSGASLAVATFTGAALADLVTYATTSLQLALAFPDPSSGCVGAFLKFGLIFVVTQIPLAVAEGILTALIMNALTAHSAAELRLLKILPGEREGT